MISYLYVCLYRWAFSVYNFLVSCCGLFFFAQRSSFNIFCKVGLVVLTSFSFCLSGKLLISPSNLKESLAGQTILGCRFFPFVTLSISYHSFLDCRASTEKSADSLMGVPLYVICCFSRRALVFSVYLWFLSFWLQSVSVCSSLGDRKSVV